VHGMRIKRFFARDIREAIRLVREEQGPDAVILSNRQVDGGVEIVAAVDYDANLVSDLAINTGSGAAAGPAEQPAPDRPSKRPGADVTPPPAPDRDPAPTRVEWSQDPALVEMRRELEDMRGLLEHQLAGLAWGERARRHPQQTRLLRLLMESGFSPALCEDTVSRIPDDIDFLQARRLALGMLARRLPVTDDDILRGGGVVVLVGPTGVGKTTTVAKLAARFALRHGARGVAMITTDNFRVGAHEQLRTYAQVMDVPLRAVRSSEELKATLGSLSGRRLVLIDTAGMSQRDLRLAEQFALLRSGGEQVRTYLVLAANTEREAMQAAVKAYRGADPLGCILTKLDEAASLGPVLSAVIEEQLPVAYVADGQRVPEDLHPARAHSLISHTVALTGQALQQRDASARRQEHELMEDVSMALAFGGGRTNAHA
jgi:flagellar biosynthesis protein FlhF